MAHSSLTLDPFPKYTIEDHSRLTRNIEKADPASPLIRETLGSMEMEDTIKAPTVHRIEGFPVVLLEHKLLRHCIYDNTGGSLLHIANSQQCTFLYKARLIRMHHGCDQWLVQNLSDH